MRGIKLIEENLLNEVMNSTTAAKKIAGIPNRNENFAALLRSQPDTRAVDMVTPDLETPGKIAKA